MDAKGVGYMNGRRGFDGEAAEVAAEGVRGELVHLVVEEPERDFGDAGGPFFNFNAVHLIDVDAKEGGDVEEGIEFRVEGFENIEFEGAEFTIGDDEEIAAAASGVEETERREFVMESGELLLAGLDGRKFRAEVVEKEGADELHNVAFGGVVGADLATFLGQHGGLEKRAEDGGGDFGPLETGTIEESLALAGSESGEAERFAEEFTIDIGEGENILGEVGVAWSRGVSRT